MMASIIEKKKKKIMSSEFFELVIFFYKEPNLQIYCIFPRILSLTSFSAVYIILKCK